MGKLSLVRPSPPIKAVGIAIDLLHLQEPFANWPAHELVSTVKGAVRRNHYILLKEGNKFVGVACWGLCGAEVGENYLAGKVRPSFKECTEGDNLLLFIVHSKNPSHLKSMARFVKEYHPGVRIIGRRYRSTERKLVPKTVLISQ